MMNPKLSEDEDVDSFFDNVIAELKSNFGVCEKSASELARKYYLCFRDPVFCKNIGIPVQDDDFFFHESAGGVALRIYYYLVLKKDPNPHAFIRWRSSL